MEKKILALGVLPLLLGLVSCTPVKESEDEAIKAKLYEEVKLQQDIDVDRQSGFTSEEYNAFMGSLNDKLDNELLRIRSHYYSKSTYDKDGNSTYTYDTYQDVNYYSDYVCTVHQDVDTITKTDAVKYSDHSENNRYYVAIPNHEMVVHVKLYSDPSDDYAKRYFYSNSNYSQLKDKTEAEKKELFYKTVYNEFTKLDFNSTLSLSSLRVYLTGDAYLLDYTTYSMNDYDYYSKEYIKQFLINVDKEGYITNFTAFLEEDVYLKINNKYIFQYVSSNGYRRIHFDYGNRVASDGSALKTCEDTFKRGVFEGFSATILAYDDSLRVTKYAGLTSNYVQSAIGYNSIYIDGGSEGKVYKVSFAFEFKYLNNMYGNPTTIDAKPSNFELINYGPEYVTEITDNYFFFKYTLTPSNTTYKYMYFNFNIKMTVDEGIFKIGDSSLRLSFAS